MFQEIAQLKSVNAELESKLHEARKDLSNELKANLSRIQIRVDKLPEQTKPKSLTPSSKQFYTTLNHSQGVQDPLFGRKRMGI